MEPRWTACPSLPHIYDFHLILENQYTFCTDCTNNPNLSNLWNDCVHCIWSWKKREIYDDSPCKVIKKKKKGYKLIFILVREKVLSIFKLPTLFKFSKMLGVGMLTLSKPNYWSCWPREPMGGILSIRSPKRLKLGYPNFRLSGTSRLCTIGCSR